MLDLHWNERHGPLVTLQWTLHTLLLALFTIPHSVAIQEWKWARWTCMGWP